MAEDKTLWFIEKSKDVHGPDTFDYSQTKFVSFRETKYVFLKCNRCNEEFETHSKNHIEPTRITKKQGCPRCAKFVKTPPHGLIALQKSAMMSANKKQ